MDQDLKQRLVGAIVITSLAAIFVPMLFDDPVDESGKMISELKIPDAPPSFLSETPRSVDDVISLPTRQSIKQEGDEMLRWFIQVGIFGEKVNALTLRNKMRRQGFPTIITSVASDNGTLYRVRIGPELSKQRVEQMKEKVDRLNNIKGIITSVDE